tara:strand:- start:14 stop:181 length:168 start_codon:yes stop_codon:yes gene_type:complete
LRRVDTKLLKNIWVCKNLADFFPSHLEKTANEARERIVLISAEAWLLGEIHVKNR